MERRILGCLVEKEAATPDNYPLSTNALMAACNQATNRDPVMDIDERTIDATMLELRTAGLARTVTGGRANKHRHVLGDAWGLSQGELAVVAVLFLRGPQTVNELRTRTDRLHGFDDNDAVERCLEGLASRHEPFVAHLDRQPGQKERRWAHLLGDHTAEPMPAAPGSAAAPSVPASPPAPAAVDAAPVAGGAQPSPASASNGEVEMLRAEVDRLRADVDKLYQLLGETPDS